MQRTHLRVLASCLAAVWAASLVDAAEPVSFESLLREMVDRPALARSPLPAYTCRQSSSYDRDAVSPQAQETWYANWDRSQFVRTEEREGRKEYVMHDVQGPGTIVRIWATWHGPRGKEFSNGTIRFYLDGQEEPTIEGPITEVLDNGALAGPPLSQGVSPETQYGQRGHNLYLPIPYASSCKITYSTDVLVDRGAKEGEALYYQINYRTYEEGTPVQSFSMEQLAGAKALIEQTNEVLATGRRDRDLNWTTREAAGELPAGETTEPITLRGPGAIRSLQCQIDADDLEQALRSTVLEITFDGEPTVWCPVGEFCGTGYRVCPHQTWYTRVDKNGLMSAAWVMPFGREAVIRLHNLGDQPIQIVQAAIEQSDWVWDDRSMHFHATWRQLTEADTRGKKDMTGQNAFDVNYVTVRGKGVYVGDTLTVFNGAAAWWGEGDEKIFVDGEEFPSHFGTGTEDYYGYAWCKAEFFNAPFHAQPEGGGNLAGGFSVNSRYRTLDAIPFERSIQFDMELWHWAGTKVNYAPATFWYARPGAECNVPHDPATAAKPVAKERTDIVPVVRVEGAIEGEAIQVVERTGGNSVVQSGGYGWSGEAQLWWTDGKVGDKLVLEVPVEKAGRYKIMANLTKAVDYGIVQFSVEGGSSKRIDRFHPSVEHDLLELGTFDLQQGANRLTVEIIGMNAKGIKRHMFGLDYLKLEVVE